MFTIVIAACLMAQDGKVDCMQIQSVQEYRKVGECEEARGQAVASLLGQYLVQSLISECRTRL